MNNLVRSLVVALAVAAMLAPATASAGRVGANPAAVQRSSGGHTARLETAPRVGKERTSPRIRKGLRLRSRMRAAVRAHRRSQPGVIRSMLLEAPALTVRALRHHPRLFAKGLIIDGPKHTIASIKSQKPAFFGGMVAVATAGGLAKAYNVHIEPAVIAASLSLLAIQAREAVRYVREMRLGPEDTARAIAERFAFPMLVVNSATVAGVAVGHADAAVAHSTMQKFATGAAANGLIGGDSPAIAATILAERNNKKLGLRPAPGH